MLADWKRLDTDGECVGRNPYLTASLIIACRRLRNPDQAGLAYYNCETRVARATSRIECPTRPCSLVVFIAYIDFAAFPTTACT